ncbi:hypothetical protein LTS18_015151, partial [Coniosporium uncinatum]
MASYDYGLLPEAEEEALHETRFHPIERRPFERVRNSLLRPDQRKFIRPNPFTPPDSPEDVEAQREKELAERRNFREILMCDFAALEAAMVRIQLLHQANEKERAR